METETLNCIEIAYLSSYNRDCNLQYFIILNGITNSLKIFLFFVNLFTILRQFNKIG